MDRQPASVTTRSSGTSVSSAGTSSTSWPAKQNPARTGRAASSGDRGEGHVVEPGAVAQPMPHPIEGQQRRENDLGQHRRQVRAAARVPGTGHRPAPARGPRRGRPAAGRDPASAAGAARRPASAARAAAAACRSRRPAARTATPERAARQGKRRRACHAACRLAAAREVASIAMRRARSSRRSVALALGEAVYRVGSHR